MEEQKNYVARFYAPELEVGRFEGLDYENAEIVPGTKTKEETEAIKAATFDMRFVLMTGNYSEEHPAKEDENEFAHIDFVQERGTVIDVFFRARPELMAAGKFEKGYEHLGWIRRYNYCTLSFEGSNLSSTELSDLCDLLSVNKCGLFQNTVHERSTIPYQEFTFRGPHETFQLTDAGGILIAKYNLQFSRKDAPQTLFSYEKKIWPKVGILIDEDSYRVETNRSDLAEIVYEKPVGK